MGFQPRPLSIILAAALLCATAHAQCDFCDLALAPNLLTNTGIEEGVGQTNITGWIITGSGAREDTNAYGFTGAAMQDGFYALKGWNDDLDCRQTNIAVGPDRAYCASAYFYHSSTVDVIANSPTSTRMFVTIDWYDTNHLFLTTHTSANHNGTWPADVWTQVVLDVTSPGAAASADVHVRTDRDTEIWGSIFGDAFFFGEFSHPSLGWRGTVLDDGESLANWSVGYSAGSTGSLELAEGINRQCINMVWDMGTGTWIQASRTFSPAADLSGADMIGLSLRGGQLTDSNNIVRFMLSDTNDVFYGCEYSHSEYCLNQISRWMVNISIPRNSFRYLWGPTTNLDWSAISRFFFTVARPAGEDRGGGSGELGLDHLQYDRAADWPAQSAFEQVAPDSAAASNAIAYILSQQEATGLCVSWDEEPSPAAWLYDQALALIALTRAGEWQNLCPTNDAAEGAKLLADFLIAGQKVDGHWARGWNAETGDEVSTNAWVGDQAWATLAMALYAQKAWDTSAWASAKACAAWIAPLIDETGKVHNSTEANVDTWWAMMSTLRTADAVNVKGYLLNSNTVWDADVRYWWGGNGDAGIYMDCATWLSAFARHPSVGETNKALDALRIVRRTLRTATDDLSLCGMGHRGPLSVLSEWSGQYVAAGGEDAQAVLDALLSLQEPDGGMPGSPDTWPNNPFSWCTTWRGISSTAWLYFGLTGQPFPEHFGAYGTGTVAYTGPQAGDIRILFTNAADSKSISIPSPGAYASPGFDLAAECWITAYRDSNANGSNDPWEACGACTNGPVSFTNALPALDIVLADPDLDADGMADYWEYRYFNHPTNGNPSVDSDGDGRPNLEEFLADTDPGAGISCLSNTVIEAAGGDVLTLYAGPPTTNTRLYDLDLTPSLTGTPAWVALNLDVRGSDAGAAIPLSVTNTAERGYYRLVVSPP